MRRPRIGIPTSMMVVEQGSNPGLERYFAAGNYVRAVLEAGGLPVLFPLAGGASSAEGHMEMLDGLLLLGGADADPALFGEEPVLGLEQVCPERDEYEIAILQMAKEAEKPILGICRGMQMINIAFGGTLYQDLPGQYGEGLIQHRQVSLGYVPCHSVEVGKGTLLESVLCESELRTNSFHHQAVKRPAPGFVVSARSRDGVIEAIELQEARILGVQWHPEMMFSHDSRMLKPFEWLVAEARMTERCP